MKNEYSVIHLVLHNPEYGSVDIAGKQYPVRIAGNGCRFIDYDGIRFMEQNKNKMHGKKLSPDAIRARSGTKITWGIRPGKWIKIES